VYECPSCPNKILKVLYKQEDIDEKNELNPVGATGGDADWIKYDFDQQKSLSDYFLNQSDKYADIFNGINGIYIALLALFGFVNANVLTTTQWWQKGLIFLPFPFWLAGVLFFIRIKEPSITLERPNSPIEIRRQVYHSNEEKAKNYRNGIIYFMLGIGCMIIVLLAILTIPVPVPAAASPTPAANVQLLINNDSVQYVSQIPIDFVNGTDKTVNVTLFNSTDTIYTIGLPDNDTVQLQKSWVQTVIWRSGSGIQGDLSNPVITTPATASQPKIPDTHDLSNITNIITSFLPRST